MNKVVIGALHLLGLYSEDEVADTIPAPPPEQPMREDLAEVLYDGGVCHCGYCNGLGDRW